MRRLQEVGSSADADSGEAGTEAGDASAESSEVAAGPAGASEVAYDWRDVARPMPYGLDSGTGKTFEWVLQTDDCGDCVFYEETDGTGACTVHPDRPLICRTYPFSVGSLSGGDHVEHTGEGDDATESRSPVGRTEPMGGVVDREGVVVHDSEGQKRPDGTPLPED